MTEYPRLRARLDMQQGACGGYLVEDETGREAVWLPLSHPDAERLAHLFAAAPDLVEAAHGVMPALDRWAHFSGHDPVQCGCSLCHAALSLRAALSRLDAPPPEAPAPAEEGPIGPCLQRFQDGNPCCPRPSLPGTAWCTEHAPAPAEEEVNIYSQSQANTGTCGNIQGQNPGLISTPAPAPPRCEACGGDALRGSRYCGEHLDGPKCAVRWCNNDTPPDSLLWTCQEHAIECTRSPLSWRQWIARVGTQAPPRTQARELPLPAALTTHGAPLGTDPEAMARALRGQGVPGDGLGAGEEMPRCSPLLERLCMWVPDVDPACEEDRLPGSPFCSAHREAGERSLREEVPSADPLPCIECGTPIPPVGPIRCDPCRVRRRARLLQGLRESLRDRQHECHAGDCLSPRALPSLFCPAHQIRRTA